MPAQADRRVVAIADEAAFADGGSWGTHYTTRTKDGPPDVSSIDYEWLEDGRTTPGGGSDEMIRGAAYPVIAPSFSTHCAGLDTAAGDGDTAADNFTVLALEACLQSPADLTDGDVIAGTPALDSLEDTDSGAHALSNSSIGLVYAELDDGTYDWMPYTYAADTMTGLMNLADVPSAGNDAHGAAIIPYVHNWSGAIGVSKAMRFVNRDGGADTDVLVKGMFGTFEIPGVDSRGIPQFNWTWSGAGFEDDGGQLAADADTNKAGVVMAGATIRIAKYGVKTWSEYCVKDIAFNLNAAYNWTGCIKRGNAEGVSGAERGDGVPALTATLPRGATPPASLSSGATRFRDSRRIGGDSYHVLVSWGDGGPGRASALYFPKCHLAAVTVFGTTENEETETLVFEPSAGMTEPLLVWGLS